MVSTHLTLPYMLRWANVHGGGGVWGYFWEFGSSQDACHRKNNESMQKTMKVNHLSKILCCLFCNNSRGINFMAPSLLGLN